jgi:hypothetical protein
MSDTTATPSLEGIWSQMKNFKGIEDDSIVDHGNGAYTAKAGNIVITTGRGGIELLEEALKKQSQEHIMAPATETQSVFESDEELAKQRFLAEKEASGRDRKIKSSKGKFPSNRQPGKKKRKKK